jgi:hypothetical protein
MTRDDRLSRKRQSLTTSGVSERRSDVDIAAQMGRGLFLDEKIPRHESGQGYVRVVEHSIMWKERHQ